MNEPYKLLVIDNDFHAYSTPNSLNLAIDLLRNEGKRWAYYLHLQTDGVKALEQNGYNAVLIDNDFGEGMNSLDKIIQTFVSRVPIAYISAYTPEALRIQARELCERGKTGIFPEEFERSGVIKYKSCIFS